MCTSHVGDTCNLQLGNATLPLEHWLREQEQKYCVEKW